MWEKVSGLLQTQTWNVFKQLQPIRPLPLPWKVAGASMLSIMATPRRSKPVHIEKTWEKNWKPEKTLVSTRAQPTWMSEKVQGAIEPWNLQQCDSTNSTPWTLLKARNWTMLRGKKKVPEALARPSLRWTQASNASSWATRPQRIEIWPNLPISIPVAPHKAVEEISKIGNYRRHEWLWCMDDRANPLMEQKVAVLLEWLQW